MSLKYSKDFKQSTIQKILMPGGPTIMEMAVKTGAHPTSIRDWMKIYGKSLAMKKTTDWTPENKLEAIIKTSAMRENELGEFLRANGLHTSDIDQWKQDIYSSLKAPGRPRIDPELIQLRNKEKELSKDLRRKDRALAEMSARVILLKKSRAIFGELEDDE
jgi:transposase